MATHADVVVVGAGTSGATASALLAERGFRVLCVDRRPLDESGARWVNSVPRAAFVEAGVELPGPDESEGDPVPFHLVTPYGRAVVPEHDLLDIDMRKLVARLQRRAVAAGAELRGEVTVHGRVGDRLDTSAGPVHARWFVDASGLTGARLLDQPAVEPEDLCAAAQEVREVTDPEAARAFFRAHDVPPGEILAMAGVAGGFSILNVRLHRDEKTMAILTGSIPALGYPSGRAILDEFVEQHSWVGERVFGGSAAIPLRRPYDRLADDRVVLLGDAGCQVFPAHGSGIGAGMIAARVLADTLAAGGTLRDYEVAWQRRHGGLFAWFDVFRRWNQSVDVATIGQVLGLGLLDAEMVRAGLDQALPKPSLRSVAAKVRTLIGEPALASQLATTAARSAAVRALYAAYPRKVDQVAAWSRSVDWLLR